MPNESLLKTLVVGLVALPLVSAAVVALLGRTQARARGVALLLALLHLGLTAAVLVPAVRVLGSPERAIADKQVFAPILVPGSSPDEPGTTNWTFIGSPRSAGGGVEFFLGLDGLNVWLVGLASVMMVPVVLSSWTAIGERAGAFYAWLFVLQGATVGVFLALDLVLFYTFFELTLIPLFFLVGQWGVGAARREAARKLFLYTLFGSLLTLVGLVLAVATICEQAGAKWTFSIPELAALARSLSTSGDPARLAAWEAAQGWLFAALAVGFAVKVPVVPLHSWLPAAYAEAPTGVVVYLSALLAKMGTFGLVRIAIPLAPDGALTVGLQVLGTLGAVGILYAALVAYAQTDVKRMIAYSSVSHLGFCVLALMALNAEGLSGGVLHMVNHGLSTGALFVLVGLLVDRYGTHGMASYGGLMGKLPLLSLAMMVATLASIGLPGLNNFVSEVLMLGGLFKGTPPAPKAFGLPTQMLVFGCIAGIGVFLGAWYMLTMVMRVFFGQLREPLRVSLPPAKDLNGRELFAVVPLLGLCLALGLFPQTLLNVMKPETERLAKVAAEARAAVAPATLSPTPAR